MIRIDAGHKIGDTIKLDRLAAYQDILIDYARSIDADKIEIIKNIWQLQRGLAIAIVPLKGRIRTMKALILLFTHMRQNLQPIAAGHADIVKRQLVLAILAHGTGQL